MLVARIKVAWYQVEKTCTTDKVSWENGQGEMEDKDLKAKQYQAHPFPNSHAGRYTGISTFKTIHLGWTQNILVKLYFGMPASMSESMAHTVLGSLVVHVREQVELQLPGLALAQFQLFASILGVNQRMENLYLIISMCVHVFLCVCVCTRVSVLDYKMKMN